MLARANLCKDMCLGEETMSIPRMLFRFLFALFQSRLERHAVSEELRDAPTGIQELIDEIGCGIHGDGIADSPVRRKPS